MFERFTDKARAVVVHAQDEARDLRHNYIGTEHLLLGLYASPGSVAALALRKLGLSRDKVRAGVESLVGQGKDTPGGHIPFTKRAKKVLELALREALQLGHNYIGTEHILLALVREGEGVAAQIIMERGIALNDVRQGVLGLLADAAADAPPPSEGASAASATAHTDAVEDALSAAQELAGGAPIGSHHLLEALMNAEGSMAARVLASLGIDAESIAVKVDEFDPEDTTDATPEETAARKMELRVEGDEVHVVLRDGGTVELARAITEQAGGPVTAAGSLPGAFVPLWAATNALLRTLHRALPDAECADELDKASTLVRRVLHGRLRRRRRP